MRIRNIMFPREIRLLLWFRCGFLVNDDLNWTYITTSCCVHTIVFHEIYKSITDLVLNLFVQQPNVLKILGYFSFKKYSEVFKNV